MAKLELFVSIAIGQISVVISMLKRQPQTPKIRKWIVGLKAASAALAEIITDTDSETQEAA